MENTKKHIPDGWVETTLGEIIQNGHYQAKNNLREPLSSNIRSQRQGVYPYYGAASAIDYIDDYRFDGYHLLIAEDGTVTSNGINPMLQLVDGQFWVSNHAHVLFALQKWKTRFLYFMLSNVNINPYITGAVQPKLSKENLYKISFLWPTSETQQQAIARMLSSFDDKIELLREQNETLEKTAQTIFAEWFGKYSPDRPEELPEGWRVGQIYDFLSITYGFPFKSTLFNEESNGFPLIRIRDLKDGKPQVFTPEKVSEIYFVNPGDILAGMDAEFFPVIYSGERGVLNQRVCRFNPKEGVGKYFMLEFIRPYLSFFQATKFGTTVSHLGKSDLDSIVAVLPDMASVEKFSKITNPIYEKIVSNNSQIQSLSKSRDTLLPKLMSGEVRV